MILVQNRVRVRSSALVGRIHIPISVIIGLCAAAMCSSSCISDSDLSFFKCYLRVGRVDLKRQQSSLACAPTMANSPGRRRQLVPLLEPLVHLTTARLALQDTQHLSGDPDFSRSASFTTLLGRAKDPHDPLSSPLSFVQRSRCLRPLVSHTQRHQSDRRRGEGDRSLKQR